MVEDRAKLSPKKSDIPFSDMAVNEGTSVNGSTNNTKVMPIFLDSLGYVTESSGSCIFVIKDNIIATPKTQFSILPSITRLFLLKILKEKLNGYIVKETTIDRWDLFNSESLFLVGTNIEIAFIENLDHVSYDTSLEINQKIFSIFKNKVIND